MARMPSTSPQIAAAKREAFLKALALTGVVAKAAAAIGMDRSTVSRWRADPAFSQAWDEALEEAADRLEAEAIRRAVEGVEEPVYQGGQLVGTRTVYSDMLLGKLLGANRPAKFRERYDVTSAGTLTLNVVTGVPQPGEDLV